jgi:predicted ATPase
MNLPRTVLSATNAAESPTALMARREMRSWRLLQLEPSALRRPDEFSAPTKLGANGSHLAATLYRLAHQNGDAVKNTENPNVCARVTNRLAELIENVRTVSIERDEKRELLTVSVTGLDKTAHAARSLSDGTLRFLALAVLEQDSEVQGVLCLEEPENGIHPARIPAMIRLLQDIATNPKEPVSPDNPLRQVIVNTHSPSVFLQVPPDSVLMALPAEVIHSGVRFGGVRFCCIPDTWRTRSPESHVCAKGDFLPYLNPVPPVDSDLMNSAVARRELGHKKQQCKHERVVDLLQIWFPGFQPESSDQHD